MKKQIAVILSSIILSCALTGCASSESPNYQNDGNSSSSYPQSTSDVTSEIEPSEQSSATNSSSISSNITSSNSEQSSISSSSSTISSSNIESDSSSSLSETSEPTQISDLSSSSSSATSVDQSVSSENSTSGASFVEKYASDIVVASSMTINNFTSKYKYSLAPQNWTIALFDDAGAVFAMVTAEKKSTYLSEELVVVLTPEMENGKMVGSTGHFVLAGDSVLYDDGYCDDVFSLLMGLE